MYVPEGDDATTLTPASGACEAESVTDPAICPEIAANTEPVVSTDENESVTIVHTAIRNAIRKCVLNVFIVLRTNEA
jgi:hypothetical protein